MLVSGLIPHETRDIAGTEDLRQALAPTEKPKPVTEYKVLAQREREYTPEELLADLGLNPDTRVSINPDVFSLKALAARAHEDETEPKTR